jgi:hypothetical protein
MPVPGVQRQPVPLTADLRAGRTVAVASCNPAGYTPDLIDYLGPSGLDGVWIETEHGTPDFQDIANLSRAADLWNMASVVRIHQNDPGLIGRILDCGASGVVVPGGGRVVAVVGLEDVVVVDTGDALLVTSYAHAQEVKAVREVLEQRGRGDLT